MFKPLVRPSDLPFIRVPLLIFILPSFIFRLISIWYHSSIVILILDVIMAGPRLKKIFVFVRLKIDQIIVQLINSDFKVRCHYGWSSNVNTYINQIDYVHKCKCFVFSKIDQNHRTFKVNFLYQKSTDFFQSFKSINLGDHFL